MFSPRVERGDGGSGGGRAICGQARAGWGGAWYTQHLKLGLAPAWTDWPASVLLLERVRHCRARGRALGGGALAPGHLSMSLDTKTVGPKGLKGVGHQVLFSRSH